MGGLPRGVGWLKHLLRYALHCETVVSVSKVLIRFLKWSGDRTYLARMRILLTGRDGVRPRK